MSYRDKIYIIKDIILKLVEYGELNQTALVSFCGLNMTKHKPLIDDLEAKQLISKNLILVGKRAITVYKPSPKGLEFCKSILEPYEIMFPRLASMYSINKPKISLQNLKCLKHKLLADSLFYYFTLSFNVLILSEFGGNNV